MEPVVGIRAAQYVRMSTENQQYSIANQKDAIEEYASNHGYVIVTTYADEGKSGVGIKTRDGLQRLLRDVVGGEAQFKTILVYDVSRWGRFQDLDEAAHYEFLCKSAGIPVCYCAEQFINDDTMPSSIMKALKRTMAAEYSRELSTKVLAGQVRLARMGFRTCGTAGLGLRRMMVSPDGLRKLILQDGEQKAIQEFHTILVPGPQKEIETVKNIFALASDQRNSPRRIARKLNQQKVWPWPCGERRWNDEAIHSILTNEKYVGNNVYGKTTKKLGGLTRRAPRAEWIIAPGAFSPLVDLKLFEKVQRIIQSRRTSIRKPLDYYLNGLKRVLARHGKITLRLLTGSGICSHGMYSKRFGSLMRAYELVGYTPSVHAFKSVANQTKARSLRTILLQQLKEIYPKNVRIVHLPGQTVREVIEFDRHVRITIHICRQVRSTICGEPRWLLKAQPLEVGYPALICLPDRGLTTLWRIYLVPEFGGIINKYKTLKENHRWLAAGQKVEDLSQLRVLATAMAGGWQEKDDTTVVGDVVISSRTSTFTIGRKEITLPPVNAELFKLLLRNAGTVVPRAQLFHPFTGSEFPSAHLNAHMCELPRTHLAIGTANGGTSLRRKLGNLLRRRIQTVVGEGYKYEIPCSG